MFQNEVLVGKFAATEDTHNPCAIILSIRLPNKTISEFAVKRMDQMIEYINEISRLNHKVLNHPME